MLHFSSPQPDVSRPALLHEGEGTIWFDKSCPLMGFPGAQMVKNPPAVQETWVRFLGWEDLLEEGTATHSSVLAWRIPWTEEPGGLQSMESQRIRRD